VLRTDGEAAASSPAPGRPEYTGPALQLSPRIWRVLAPVHHELSALSPYVLRRVAREIGSQLDAYGGSEERLADRLTRRYASSKTIRDFGRWLLGAALVRRGCGDARCESGVIWDSGADCETCALNRQVERARTAQAAKVAERARLLEEQRQQRERAAARTLPAKRTYRQRTRATDDEIRAAIAEHGPVVALHLYGHLRALPLLHGHQSAADGGEES